MLPVSGGFRGIGIERASARTGLPMASHIVALQ
jgi:hypothetical protein